jgi:hypothetical protein
MIGLIMIKESLVLNMKKKFAANLLLECKLTKTVLVTVF